MTMYLGGDAFFKSYLKTLSDKQLNKLYQWNGELLGGKVLWWNGKKESYDPQRAAENRKLIHQERKSRVRPRC